MNKHLPPKFNWQLAAVLAVCAAVALLIATSDVGARNRLFVDPANVVIVLPPPVSMNCRVLAFEIVGPGGTILHAAFGSIDPDSGVVEAVPLSTSKPPRLFCDGYE